MLYRRSNSLIAFLFVCIATGEGRAAETLDMEPVLGELLSIRPDHQGFLGSDPSELAYVIDPKPLLDLPESQVINVGVIDSGINSAHPQLSGTVAESVSFTESSEEDTLGHGTSVAILATIGVPARLFSAKVTNERHEVILDAVLAAIDWLVEKDVRLINMSLGFDASIREAHKICERISRHAGENGNVLFIVAAGNQGSARPMIPAACGSPNLLVVATAEDTSGAGDVAADLPVATDRITYLSLRAQTLLQESRTAEAIPLLEELYANSREDPTLGYQLAASYFNEARPDLALATITETLALEPTMEAGLWLQALSLANLAYRERAISALKQLITLNPKYPMARDLFVFLQDKENALPHSLENFFNTR